MAEPTILSFTPIDATVDNTITFVYSGSQPYSNRLIIYDAETLAVVYDVTQSTMVLRHTIAAGSLTNGTKYCATVTCYDQDSQASTTSDKLYFWALSTPTFEFADIVDEQTIDVSTFAADINYTQAEGELIEEYRFYIYDSVRALLATSDALYDKTDISYTYTGLENETTYFIRAQGVTEKGIPLDTGYIQIFIYYEHPENYANIYAEQTDPAGIVSYYTNFTAIDPADPTHTFEFDGGYIVLTDDVLLYNSNFDVNGDFSVGVKMKYMGAIDGFLKLYNSFGEELRVSVVEGDEEIRVKLLVAGGYVQYSQSLSPTSSEDLIVWVQRKGNLFKLTVTVQERG